MFPCSKVQVRGNTITRFPDFFLPQSPIPFTRQKPPRYNELCPQPLRANPSFRRPRFRRVEDAAALSTDGA